MASAPKNLFSIPKKLPTAGMQTFTEAFSPVKEDLAKEEKEESSEDEGNNIDPVDVSSQLARELKKFDRKSLKNAASQKLPKKPLEPK